MFGGDPGSHTHLCKKYQIMVKYETLGRTRDDVRPGVSFLTKWPSTDWGIRVVRKQKGSTDGDPMSIPPFPKARVNDNP